MESARDDSPDVVDDGGDPLLVMVSKRIRDMRTAAGLTQSEVATRIAMSKGYYWKIEQGRQMISLRQLARIAAAIGTSMAAILADIPSELAEGGPRTYVWKSGHDVRPPRSRSGNADAEG